MNDIKPALPQPVVPVQAQETARPVAKTAPTAPQAAPSVPQSHLPRFDAQAAQRELQQAIERLNEQAKKNNYNLNFSYDKASNHVVVKVRTASGEVLRQIPDETVLRLAENMQDIKGLMQDEKI